MSGSVVRVPAVPGDEAVDGGGAVGGRDSLGERDGDLVEAHRGRDLLASIGGALVALYSGVRTSVYDAGMRLRPMLQVSDVVGASRWYQGVLGLTSGHGGDEFEMLFSGDALVLQLHRLDAHEHGLLVPDASDVRGAGVSLWFETSDRSAFDALFERAESAGATILERPHWNPLAHHHEATMVDAEGYIVVIHSPFEADG